MLLASICVNAQTVSNTQANFSCPGTVTVTYDLKTPQPVDVILYYSHNKRDWLTAQTVTGDLTAQTTGTGKTITWNNYADNVRYGKFYFKIDVPDCVMIADACWAMSNVGAPGTFVDNSEDKGMLYQWNRKIGWSATNPRTSSPAGQSWNSVSSSDSVWEAANDPCPDGFRVPTDTEIQNLISAGSIWDSSRNGFIFGSGTNTIFMPAAGYRDFNGTLSVAGIFAYWSNTLMFLSNLQSPAITLSHALSVRCVKE